MGNIFTGTSLTLTCHINSSATDNDVPVTAVWLDSQRNEIHSTHRFTVSDLITVDQFVYISTLTITPLNTSDSGMYHCVSTVNSLENYYALNVEGKSQSVYNYTQN